MAEQSVLITGATGGLGRAVTQTFHTHGWRVVAPVRPVTTENAVPAGLQHHAEIVTADLTEPVAANQVVRVAAGEPSAPLRAVINLVGGFAMAGRIHRTPITDFETMLSRNLRPTYLVTAAALPYLMEAGAAAPGGAAVVCVSAQAARHPFPGAAGYIAAKAAVLAFASAVAVEYAENRVRCNTVLPGIIDTPGNRAAMPGADHASWVAPEKIARVIHFLGSADSAPTTGAEVPVDSAI